VADRTSETACVADVSFSFSRRGIERASEETSAPGMSKKWGGGVGVRKKKEEKEKRVETKAFIFPAQPPPLLLILSHSLAVSFPSRVF